MANNKFAKKSLGQNFLNSTAVRDRIVKESGDIKGKHILEIGPGLGFLTAALFKAKGIVTAVELDERSFNILTKNFEDKKDFTLIHGDVIKLDMNEVFPNKTPYAVIANIPYNITSMIIRKLLAESDHRPDFCTFMVQKEVGEKICTCAATPVPYEFVTSTSSDISIHTTFTPPVLGSIPKRKKDPEKALDDKKKKRSLLSVSVEVFATTEYLFTVPRECFDPSPKVDSAVIKLTMRDKPLISKEMEKDFFTVVSAGFAEKRKKIGTHIGTFFGVEPKKILGDIDPNRRAEELEIDEWVYITKNFQKLGL